MMYSFGIRLAAAFVLVFVTINPTQYNYVRWVMGTDGDTGQLPYLALAGIVLLIGWVIFLRATVRSIGLLGAALVAILVAAVVWVLIAIGVVDLQNPGVLLWIVLIGASIVLGVGISWSIIRKRITGQLDVDDVEQ